MKFYNGNIKSNFHNNKIAREGSQFICLSGILINSVFRTGKNYYPQVFLEECKYLVKAKKITKYIIDDIEISCDSDREASNEQNSDEENFENANITHIKNTKRDCKKKHGKDTKIFLKKKKRKGGKSFEKYIKILLKKKIKIVVSIIRNVTKNYLSIEEIII